MSTRLKYLGTSAGVVAVYALATLPILVVFPPAWPDEVLFYSPAAALARGQGMGTPVLAGFLPGIARYTYWQPPGYFFFLSLVLRFVTVSHHFLAMRLFSWFLGVVVLLLGVAILKRLAVKPSGVFLGLIVLGMQASFIQAANVGRMEMLTLALTLAALDAYLAFREKRRAWLLAWTGFLAGVATVCHPVGILAAGLMVVHEVAEALSRGADGRRLTAERASVPDNSSAVEGNYAGRRWAKEVLIFLGSSFAAFVPWLLYIAQSPRLFAAQMAAQSARKSSYLGTLLTSGGYVHWIFHPFQDAIWPLGHPIGGSWPFTQGTAVLIQVLMLIVGLVVLLAEGRRRLEASLLGAWALAGYAVNLFMPEFWYAVYFSVPCCVLLGWAVSATANRWGRGLALATLILSAGLNFGMAKFLWYTGQDGSRRYKLYCATLAQKMPPHSSVLLAALPDPYFGLLEENRSYRMYEFVPEDVPVDKAQVEESLSKIDYVVGSACCRPDYLVDYLLSHGRAEVTLDEWRSLFPPIVVWKLRAYENSPVKREGRSRNEE